MQGKLLVSATIYLSFCCTVWAQSPECPGNPKEPHDNHNFHFVTSSRVQPDGNRFWYYACVANLDAGTDLLANWLIPWGRDEYVPDTKPTEIPRMNDDPNPLSVNGCLKYSSLGYMTTAHFLGSADEAARNKCAAGTMVDSSAAKPSEDANLKLGNYQTEFRIFLPSDLKNAHDTMLQVEGKIGISSEGGKYRSFLMYYATPLEGRPNGKPQDVSIKPLFPVQQHFFEKAYASNNEEVQPLNEKGFIEFEVSGYADHNWRSVEAYYQFLDRDHRVITAIPMPLLEDTGN